MAEIFIPGFAMVHLKKVSLDRVSLEDRLIFGHGRAGSHQMREIIWADLTTKHSERAIVFLL